MTKTVVRKWILLTVSVGLLALVGSAGAQPPATVQAVRSPAELPESITQALRAGSVPTAAIGISIVPLAAGGLALQHQDQVPMNPASTMKLVTTLAGLEILGPQFVWRTVALSEAPLVNGVLEGDLVLRGSGDPRFVVEHLWLLIQRLRGIGIREIRGDLVLDRSAFEAAAHDPGAFDGESMRPYNAGPDALLLNYKSISFHFVPDPSARQARVYALPAPSGLALAPTVRAVEGPCGDWRARLGGDFSDPLRPQFRGAFPLACGDRVWHVSLFSHTQYLEAVFRSLWTASGGTWRGRTRDGIAPAAARPLAQHESETLAEVIRDINKFSNNVMARQLFLTIGAEVTRQPASVERSQRVVGDWLQGKGLERREFVLENGAGLSRVERLTPAALTRLLAGAFAGPLMPEFASSLPLAGVDGTMRKRVGAAGSAHIKTGLLADTRAVAGYVLAASGRRYAVAAFVNHANAGAAQPALDELLNWIYVNG
ncbi:MAG: D-alanyl-D-alanine carboxypeptidase/D-alanyl-D-alanine-endopeptidase [Burkholderiaceae bacterium]|nr:D-alanyl-D-alanine carboxypeptidase/D-alanyl-D-alanine-endopeptidase [Burkholderiaceae bacterium]